MDFKQTAITIKDAFIFKSESLGKSKKFSTQYGTDKHLGIMLRQLSALTILPTDVIPNAFDI